MHITREECVNVMRHYCPKSKPFEIIDYHIKPIGEHGDAPLGFLGDHYTLSVLFNQDKELNKAANFFMKTIPQTSQEHMDYVQQTGVFEKEAFVYRKLLGQKVQNLFDQQFAPRCYLAKSDSYIILEDLANKGYKVVKDTLTVEHWNSLMTCLAKFHAASVIVEEERSTKDYSYRLNEHYPEELVECTFVFKEGHPRQRWAKNTAKAVADSMKNLPSYDSKIAGVFLKLLEGGIVEYTKPSERYRNVITHADLWRNNVMFRRNKNDATKVESVLVDFQLARYVPPAFDILTTIYLNGEMDFIDNNLDNILDCYYTEFSSCLRNAGINIEDVMSREEFLESIEYYKLPALVEAAMFATVIFVSSELSTRMLSNEEVFEEFTYVDRSKYLQEEFRSNENFRKCFGNVLEGLVRHLKTLLHKSV